MAMQGPNSGPTVRTQDAGTEKCYADFCADSSAQVSFGYRGGVPASHNHGPRTDTAAGAASSILSHKGTGTWVFEREWAIGSDTTTAPQAEHGKANVNGGGDVSFKPPSEAHDKYAAGLGRQTGRHSKSHSSEPPSFGSETVNYTYVRSLPKRNEWGHVHRQNQLPDSASILSLHIACVDVKPSA